MRNLTIEEMDSVAGAGCGGGGISISTGDIASNDLNGNTVNAGNGNNVANGNNVCANVTATVHDVLQGCLGIL